MCLWSTSPPALRKVRVQRSPSRKAAASALPLLRRSSSLDLSQTLSASIARTRVTGSAAVRSTYRTRRLAPSKVYLIYMLLMFTLLALVVVPGYLKLVQLLIFVTRNRSYRIDGG